MQILFLGNSISENPFLYHLIFWFMALETLKSCVCAIIWADYPTDQGPDHSMHIEAPQVLHVSAFIRLVIVVADQSSRKHAYIILTPFNPTFI